MASTHFEKARDRMRNQLMIVALALCASAAWTAPAWSQMSSDWDGSYSDAQAARGSTKYQQECAMCHGPVLEGNGEAPPLVGRFIPDWAGTTLADLFEKIQTTMPLFAPGTLNSADTADLLAFILKSNNLPAGSKELEAGDSLKLISFDVSKPLPIAKVTKAKVKK
jgi:S-disulfanyl-L-cysteine oxidoreductase SoxD